MLERCDLSGKGVNLSSRAVWKSKVRPFVLYVLLLLAALASGTAPARAQSISRQMSGDDPRLLKLVTVRQPRLYIGELLERVSAASGVKLTAGENGDGAADEVVDAFVADLPLWELMNGLRALVSYRNAEWRWIRTAGDGQYVYRLTRPRSAQLLRPRLAQLAHQTYEDHAANMIAAARMSPAELQALRSRNPVIDRLVADQRLFNGVKVFAVDLTPAQQTAVLRGERRLTVPVRELSDSGGIVREQPLRF